jgi:uncharacterized membrane protein YkoI
MSLRKKPWVLPAVFTIVILVVGGLFIGSLVMKKHPLAADDIQSKLEQMYSGTIHQLSLTNDQFSAELLKDGAKYDVQGDVFTGNVLSLIQTTPAEKENPEILSEEEMRTLIAATYSEEIEQISLIESEDPPVYEVKIAKDQKLLNLSFDAYTGNKISESAEESVSENVLISKVQATAIALEQLAGEVEYVQFEQSNDGGFYLIEIDGEEDEAVFQIHAISGKIISVTWDD